MKELQDYRQDYLLGTVSPQDPRDAAVVIIKAGASRTRELYFPYFSMQLYTVLRDILPQTMEAMFRYVYEVHT